VALSCVVNIISLGNITIPTRAKQGKGKELICTRKELNYHAALFSISGITPTM